METLQLDLKDIPCPLSFVRAKLFLEKQAKGTIVQINLANEQAQQSVTASLMSEGFQILESSDDGYKGVVIVRT